MRCLNEALQDAHEGSKGSNDACVQAQAGFTFTFFRSEFSMYFFGQTNLQGLMHVSLLLVRIVQIHK